MDIDSLLKIENDLISGGYHGKTINDISEINYISGIDISYPKNDTDLPSVAYSIHKKENFEDAVVVLKTQLETQPKIPYIPGFLGHKEAEIMVPEIEKLHAKLEDKQILIELVILVDGNGAFHPRNFGSACHVGYLTQLPTIGVAKNYLKIPGGMENDELQNRITTELINFGDYFKVDDVVAVVRTSKRTNQNPKCQPIYVSIGSGIKNLDLAVEIVLSVCKFKIPEPIRNADKESRNILKNTVSNTD